MIILTVPADPSYPDILNVNTKVTSLFYVLGVVHKVCQHFFFWGGGKGKSQNWEKSYDMEKGGGDTIAKRSADVVYGRPPISDTTFFSFRKKK